MDSQSYINYRFSQHCTEWLTSGVYLKLAATNTQAVLAIPELLENILIYLPTPHVLASAASVSRQWNTLVRSSPQLQRKLLCPAYPLKPVVARPLRIPGNPVPTYSETLVMASTSRTKEPWYSRGVTGQSILPSS